MDLTQRSNKTIAMIGGAGRVAARLRTALNGRVAGIRIVDIANPGSLAPGETWHETDICNVDEVVDSLMGIDAIVHLAGFPSERSIEEIVQVNVVGTHNVYEAARRAGIRRVVYGSSNHVVGFYPRDARVGSDDPMRPDTLYGLSKCWGELEAGLYYEKAGIESLIIRIGFAGPHPKDERSLANWVSGRDLAQLVLIGLEHPDIDCTTVYGLSGTDTDWWDNSVATRLGYVPQDVIADHAPPEAYEQKPSEMPQVADYFQGGHFAANNHDGEVRRRIVKTRTNLSNE